jgi:alpha-mannosidase
MMIQELQRIERRLVELEAWRDIDRLPLEGRFESEELKTPVPIRTGQAWPSTAFPVQLHFDAIVPVDWKTHPVHVFLQVGGEGLLFVEKEPVGGLNQYHCEYPLLASARGGEEIALRVEAVPYGLFGNPEQHPRLESARIVVPDSDVRSLWQDLATALDAVSQVEKEIADLLLDAISQTLALVALPKSPAEDYLSRVVMAPERAAILGELWEEWRFSGDPLTLSKPCRTQIREARVWFLKRLAEIGRRYPSKGELLLSGHAHLDVAWLWPLAETRRKAQRTFATVLTLMKQDRELVFSQSMAQLYAFIEEDNPSLFTAIQEKVQEGRWDLVGGMWVEPDGNLLSGESWSRQLLYGQRFFESRFGRRASVAWLPDTFGFAANLPQLFRSAGLDCFVTTKLNWNETNRFPYDLYQWEGLDGSRILSHSFHNPNGGYNARLQALDLRATWQNFRGKRQHTRSLLTFGHGDGGGGPTFEMLERFQRLKEFPGLPRLRMGPMEQLAEQVDLDRLPIWVGEQYLELHRGTYTTQAAIKALNRQLEHVLPETEIACSLGFLWHGENYPREELQNCWETLLRNQFHDILPGSGIHTVAEEAQQELVESLERAKVLRHKALSDLSQQATGHPDAISRVVVWNLSLEDRPLQLSIPRPTEAHFQLLCPDGSQVLYQEDDAGQIAVAADKLVPGLGYVTLSLVPEQPARAQDGVQVSDRVLENRHLRVEIGTDGTIHSLFDKDNEREALADRANQIWAYADTPFDWEAWDIDASYLREGCEIPLETSPEIIEHGPVRAGLRILRKIGRSTMVQTYWLWTGARRIEIETRIHWEERCRFLRALFPLAVRTHEGWFETAFGAVPRPTHQNTSWDRARFEVPGLRFVDLSEADYGVSLVNNGKYGHSAHQNVVGLSLLRGPIYPDPLADWGTHHFCYALYPHTGDWRNGTLLQAHELNAPLQAILANGNGGQAPAEQQFLRIGCTALRLSTLKQAEDWDGIVLRIYEAHGSRGSTCLEVNDLEVSQIWQVNLLEDPENALAIEEGRVRFGFKPYQVISFMLAR